MAPKVKAGENKQATTASKEAAKADKKELAELRGRGQALTGQSRKPGIQNMPSWLRSNIKERESTDRGFKVYQGIEDPEVRIDIIVHSSKPAIQPTRGTT